MFCIKVLQKIESGTGNNNLLILRSSNGNVGQSTISDFAPTQILPLKQICVGFHQNTIYRKLKSALSLRYSSSGVAYNTAISTGLLTDVNNHLQTFIPQQVRRQKYVLSSGAAGIRISFCLQISTFGFIPFGRGQRTCFETEITFLLFTLCSLPFFGK